MITASTTQHKQGLLIVDDDELILQLVSEELSDEYKVTGVRSRGEVPQALRQMSEPPSFALVDLGLPPQADSPREGLAILRELRASVPECAVIVISGQSKDDHAKLARSLGAIDFISKPCDTRKIRKVLARSKDVLSNIDNTNEILGSSELISDLQQKIKQFSNSSHPVLIEGESGTGKELVAKAIHRASKCEGKFVAINCAAVPEHLFESTLFGSVRGSYTGSLKDTPGYIAEAEGGSLFLDEIGDLTIEMQPKLLRMLESGEYYRVGDSKPSYANLRIIAATNKQLLNATKKKTFREDLYHRLSVLIINTPALRNLNEDKEVMLEYFVQQAATSANTKAFSLDDSAKKIINSYSFPGNVRELYNIVSRLQVLHPGELITAKVLESEILHAPTNISSHYTGNLAKLLEIDAKHHAEAALLEYKNDALAAQHLDISIEKLHELLDNNDNNAV